MKRYDANVCEEYAGKCHPLIEADDGDWVEYDEVKDEIERLRTENDVLKTEIGNLEDECEVCMFSRRHNAARKR